MAARTRRLISGMLVILFTLLTSAELLCAVPCGHAADPATPSPPSHCAASIDSDGTTMSAAAECGGEHARLAPAEVSSRRGVTTAAVVTDVPRALRPDLQSAAIIASPVRRLVATGSTLAPPLRI